MVTREEICARLWPDGTHVDFEHGLNTAVRKLRRALEETPEAPRFLETVAGRGYRFRGALEPDAAPGGCALALAVDAAVGDALATLAAPALGLWRGRLVEGSDSSAQLAEFASEDDAVRCAVGLVERARRGAAPTLRLGLSAGTGAASRSEAQDLCAAAERCEVVAVASLLTRLTSRDGLVWRDRAPVARPDGAHALVVSIEASDLPPAALLGRPPFVGRRSELTRLGSRLAETRAGRGGLVLVSGESGIGKTRLLEEFAAFARSRGVDVWSVRCRADRAPDPALAEAFEGTGDRAAPAIVVIDDLHLADASTLARLERLAQRASRSSLLVVGSYRDAELDPAHPLRALLSSEQVREALALPGLDVEHVQLWLEAVGPGRSSAASAEGVQRATAGNPLRVRDLLLAGGLPGLHRLLRGALPIWSTPLVGRDRERLEVAELFPEHRLVTLTGAGGCGKTRLAHAVAEDLADHFADGVSWVDLARVASPEAVVGAVAAACEVRAAGASPLGALLRRLAASERLLVLDNCEHLLDACTALVNAVREAAPGVRILATSRSPLRAAGEVTWRVPSLSLPEPGEREPGRIADSDAVSLFRGRARATRSDFRLDAANAPLVARICRRLDGIPLALELAAARVRALSLPALAEGLDDRFHLLSGGAHAALPRQRTLLASIEWSHELLEETERVLFRRLSVFDAPFDLEAAEAVAGDEELETLLVYEVLARLVDKSLVQHEGDRYRMLESIRQYAAERAKDAGEVEELRDRHLACFERRATGWRLDHELASEELLEQIAVEKPDLVAAATWCADRGRAPAALLHALRDQWWAKETYGEVRGVCTRILGSLRPESREWLEAGAPLVLILMDAAAYDVFMGMLSGIRRGIETRGAELDPATRGFLEVASVIPDAHRGSPEAIEVLRRVADRAAQTGQRKLETFTKDYLALMLAQQGNVVDARAVLASQEREDGRGRNRSLRSVVAQIFIAAAGGDLRSAMRTYEVALAQGVEHIQLLSTAAVVAFWSADAGFMQRTIARIEKLIGPGSYPLPMLQGQLLLLRDDLAAAQRALATAEEQVPFLNTRLALAVLRGQAQLATGDVAGAQALWLRIEQAVDERQAQQWFLTQQFAAHLDRVRGDSHASAAKAKALLARALRLGTRMVAVDALELLALLAGDRGALGDAALVVAATDAFRERSGYVWRPHHVRTELAQLRPRLDPAALARGKVLSLEQAAALRRAS